MSGVCVVDNCHQPALARGYCRRHYRALAKYGDPLARGPRVRAAALEGKRFGRLLVMERAGTRRNDALWKCLCDCGAQHLVASQNLLRGATRSCGCLSRDIVHGAARRGQTSAEHRIWSNMRNRCNNPNNHAYTEYGGRGIRVCERWDSFQNFFADMGPRPTPRHSIDRWPNNNGNYEPGNCRWATPRQQALNRRGTLFVTLNGKRLTLVEATEQLGISYQMVRARILRGMSPEDAIAAPPISKNEMAERLRMSAARGSSSGPAKLRESDIPMIRADSRPSKVIAREYGVSAAAIHKIKIRENWRHIP